jgi:hypothetical protein
MIMTNAPWQTAPPAGRGFKPYLGCLVLVAVGGYHDRISDGFREGPAVRLAGIVLDGPEPGAEIPEMTVSATRLVQRLRGMIGGVALGRVVGTPLPCDKTMYDLTDPTPADEALATGWHGAFPGKLAAITQSVQASFAVEEAKLHPPLSTPGWGSNPPQSPPPAQPGWGQPNGGSAPQPAWSPTSVAATPNTWSSGQNALSSADASRPPY